MKIKVSCGGRFGSNVKQFGLRFEFKNGKCWTVQADSTAEWAKPSEGVDLNELVCFDLLQHIKENELKDSEKE